MRYYLEEQEEEETPNEEHKEDLDISARLVEIKILL